MSPSVLPPPALDLAEPGTYIFTVADALRGIRLNRFARALRDADRRSELALDRAAALAASGLDAHEIELVGSRDWTGLIRAGGHLQLVLVIAAALGDSLWDIGAHHVGCLPEVLITECPRRVVGLPEQMQSI